MTTVADLERKAEEDGMVHLLVSVSAPGCETFYVSQRLAPELLEEAFWPSLALDDVARALSDEYERRPR